MRYVLCGEHITSVNDVDDLFYRIDMPGHIHHKDGDNFAQVYLSYHDKPIPAAAFKEDFAPDAQVPLSAQGGQGAGADDPGLPGEAGRQAGAVAGRHDARPGGGRRKAWCHQRGYVCFIEELHRKKVKAGETFGAAYVVGWFDDVPEMEKVYDRYKGKRSIVIDGDKYRLE